MVNKVKKNKKKQFVMGSKCGVARLFGIWVQINQGSCQFKHFHFTKYFSGKKLKTFAAIAAQIVPNYTRADLLYEK